MRYRSMLAACAAVLALGACADLPTQPAARFADRPAATVGGALTVDYMYCYDTGGGGYYYNNTFCEGTVSGGTGVYTFDWDVIETSRSDSGNYSSITGVCTDSYPVTFSVQDSNGATASRHETYVCYAKSTGPTIDP